MFFVAAFFVIINEVKFSVAEIVETIFFSHKISMFGDYLLIFKNHWICMNDGYFFRGNILYNFTVSNLKSKVFSC